MSLTCQEFVSRKDAKDRKAREVPEDHKAEAEHRAREAYVLALLRQGDISAGRAGELLGVDRWHLADLMSVRLISPFDETMTREDLERGAADTRRMQYQSVAT